MRGLCLCLPCVLGVVADKVGARKTFVFGSFLLILAIVVNIGCVMMRYVPLSLLLFTSFALKLFSIPGYALLFDKVHTNIRYRVLSLGHAIGSMLFSGTTAWVAMLIWSKTNTATAPFFYLLMFPCLALLALDMLFKPTAKSATIQQTTLVKSKPLTSAG